MKCFRKTLVVIFITLTVCSCGRTAKLEVAPLDSLEIKGVAQNPIEPIKDTSDPYLTIGYTFRTKDFKVHKFLINENNPFINKSLPPDTSQQDWTSLNRGGNFSYDISHTSLDKIRPMLPDGIFDDSIATFRFSRAGSYCNRRMSGDYVVVNYTFSVSAFKRDKKKTDIVSLSTKLLVMNNEGKTIFEISERGLGIGDFVVSDNKKYLTVYAMDYSTGRPRSGYRVYNLTTKRLYKSLDIPEGISPNQIESTDNLFLYAYTPAESSAIVRILVFDAIDGQLYEKEVDINKHLTLLYVQDGIIHLMEESEDYSKEVSVMELKLSDLNKLQ